MTQAPLVFDSGRRNLFIEAGAGTGKTTEIVRQVLEILLSDPAQEPDRIVLITFTEKAAGEIAERVRDALIDLHGSFDSGRPGWPSGADQPILPVPPDRMVAWKRACEKHIQQLDRIVSQTIHAFCQSVLARFPFQARIDPSFRIVEGFERSRILDEIWMHWVEAETGGTIAPEREREWELALEALEGVNGVREVLMHLVPHRALLLEETAPLVGFSESIAPVRRAVEEIRALHSSGIEAVGDRDALEALTHLRWEAPPEADEAEAWIRYLDPIGDHLREANLRLPREVKEPFRVLRGTERKDNVFDLLKSDRAARAVLALARRFLGAAEREKDRRGVLDFDDLLIRTERLLRDPAVARAVRRKIDFLLVDEFQDTDRLQARIVERLARDDAGTIAHGRTILVGDPKQSIYSFRRADPETYGEMLHLFVNTGARTPKLERQFRSAPALVASLNVMFSRLFSADGETNVFRPSYSDLSAGRSEEPSTPVERIRFLRAEATADPEEEESGSSDRQARAVASWIAARRDGGARLEEIAILLRKMTDVDPYLDALDRAAIPWVLPRNLSVLDRRPAIDLLAVLRAIGAPFDRGAEVSAARSPWFGLTDAEIFAGYLDARAERDTWPAASRRGSRGQDGEPAESGVTAHPEAGETPATTPGETPASTPWEEFRAEMRRWRRRSRAWSVSELIHALMRERRIETLYRLLPRGTELLADLDAFRELAREFDRQVGGSVAAFAEEMLRRRQGGSEGEGAILEQGSTGVRIMTVHASKGLEFGTVILPDLGAMTAGDALSVFTLESPSRLFVKGRVETLGTSLLKAGPRTPEEVLKLRTEAETDRLFYVGVTRAKEEVVFVIDPEKVAKQSFYKPFFRIFDLDPKSMDGLFPAEPGERADAVPAGDRVVPVLFERAAPLAPVTGASDATGRNALEQSPGEPLAEEGPPIGDEAPVDRAMLQRAAAAAAQKNAGILLHRVLELWDGDPAALEPLVEALGGELAASSRDRARALERLGRLARSPHFERLRRAREGGREVTVRFLEDGLVREARIDRLVRENGSWLVVDYKSGASSAERLARDRDQVARYCRAVAAMTGEPCRGAVWYVDLEGEEWVEVEEPVASSE